LDEDAGAVLVVDDDADVREGLELLLGRHGYTVATAADGASALEHLRTQPPPGLILLDLMMPLMNGIEFESTLRADPLWSRIPIVVITGAGARVADRVSAMRLEVIAKPFDVPALLATISRCCRRAPPTTPRPVQDPGPPTP
jgi:CheY-like chemotaxis protein